MPETRVSHWLMKTEPSECSIDDIADAPGQSVPWTGVRSYASRNVIRDAMRIGDGVLFYHSSCPEPGIAGLAEVASEARADPTQFDAASPYFDAKSGADAPRWLLRDVRLVRRTRLLSLREMRSRPELAGMRVLQRGNRLSVTPVTPAEWQAVVALLEAAAPDRDPAA